MKSIWVPILLGIILVFILFNIYRFENEDQVINLDAPAVNEVIREDSSWTAPILSMDTTLTPAELKKIQYGRDLIANTSQYLGPEGSVAHNSNGMNCQNCHLDAGAKPWGNSLAAVSTSYPKFKSRSNSIQDIYQRINDCFLRSLNGKKLHTNSIEMQSMYAYIKWLGKGVSKNKKAANAGLPELPFIKRAADAVQGNLVYGNLCQSCHGKQGEGVLNGAKTGYEYPPVWGKNSFNDGAGLFRISSMASFVSNNMPFGQALHDDPVLTTEQAWDVAAFINSQRRPHITQRHDYPNKASKPFDFPYGPYADGFKKQQHKYGPFNPIISAKTKKG